MQAIVTKYIGPTNHRSSLVTATCQAGTLTVSWDHALGVDANHTAAARALAVYLGWPGVWVGGGLPDGSGNCYVMTPAGTERGSFTVPRMAGKAPIEEGKPATGTFRRPRS